MSCKIISTIKITNTFSANQPIKIEARQSGQIKKIFYLSCFHSQVARVKYARLNLKG